MQLFMGTEKWKGKGENIDLNKIYHGPSIQLSGPVWDGLTLWEQGAGKHNQPFQPFVHIFIPHAWYFWLLK